MKNEKCLQELIKIISANSRELDCQQRFNDLLIEGRDYSKVWPKFIIWSLTSAKLDVLKIVPDEMIVYRVTELYERIIDDEEVSEEEWESARSLMKGDEENLLSDDGYFPAFFATTNVKIAVIGIILNTPLDYLTAIKAMSDKLIQLIEDVN